MSEEKTLTSGDLQKRFEKLFATKQAVEKELGQIQLVANQKQTQYQHVQGALQDTAELLVELVGSEKAQEIVNEIQKPKQEEKKDGEKN